jgi:hypothetical protein
MEFFHEIKMQVPEAHFIVCTTVLEIRVLDDEDHLHHEGVKEVLSLLNVKNSTHDAAEICANLYNIAHGADAADALNDGLAFTVMGAGHKVVLLILCIGISLDSLSDQVCIILRGKMKYVDVGRLIVIASKLCILKASIQDACCEVLAKMKHGHVCVERVE